MEAVNLQPQEGPQTEFLASLADIAIYGGAAGGGKSFALLLEPLRHYDNPDFGGVIFRRNSTQVRNEGGLWDESYKLYKLFNAHPREAFLEWIFPSGSRMKFAHLEHEKTVYDWQGAQIPYLGFDELTHFTEHQFFYMLSRNRSTSGVPGYVRATCNPDANSWVRKFIDWWINPETGLPILERSGVIRYFVRIEDKMIWADSPQEIFDIYGNGPEIQPKSVTFIAANVYDNKILLQKDPTYLANLLAQSRVDRLRLHGGNWNVRAIAGMIFQRSWFEVIDALPANPIAVLRYWDRAATKPNEVNNDPDWTRGLKLLKYADGTFVVADLESLQDTPGKVEKLVKNTATQDGYDVSVGIEQEPGASGVADADHMVRVLAGFDVRVRKPSVDKVTRAKPVSAQCEHGNVKVLRGAWNEDFFTELENFGEDEVGHDDIVDTLSGGFNELCGNPSILDVL